MRELSVNSLVSHLLQSTPCKGVLALLHRCHRTWTPKLVLWTPRERERENPVRQPSKPYWCLLRHYLLGKRSSFLYTKLGVICVFSSKEWGSFLNAINFQEELHNYRLLWCVKLSSYKLHSIGPRTTWKEEEMRPWTSWQRDHPVCWPCPDFCSLMAIVKENILIFPHTTENWWS